jgi:hypothetical protein
MTCHLNGNEKTLEVVAPTKNVSMKQTHQVPAQERCVKADEEK